MSKWGTCPWRSLCNPLTWSISSWHYCGDLSVMYFCLHRALSDPQSWHCSFWEVWVPENMAFPDQNVASAWLEHRAQLLPDPMAPRLLGVGRGGVGWWGKTFSQLETDFMLILQGLTVWKTTKQNKTRHPRCYSQLTRDWMAWTWTL